MSYPQDIVELRVLGARAEVSARPGYAWPEPGEAVDIRFLLAAPGALPELVWRFEACLMDASPDGSVLCREEAFVEREGEGTPSFRVELPLAAGGAAQLGVRGVLCETGRLAARGLECESGRRLDAAVRLGIAGEVQNRIPEITEGAFTLDGTPLSAEQTDRPCDQVAEAPRIASNARATLRLELGASMREKLPADRRGFDALGEHEALRVDWYATLGRLTPAASFIEADAPLADSEVQASWRAPEVSEPVWARLFVVARDRRGGSSHLERAVCVMP
ncbi:MAG: hypothetical protein KIT72_16325 [Polyangiaceae bacterium]|nr:hypothetical protein [Polyangiaceae bacterium]MCW5791985.1 hypothetical protein [Polyangiaceae bacterium]